MIINIHQHNKVGIGCSAVPKYSPELQRRVLYMNILVSNDDGVMAPGIIALYEALRAVGQVTVVAPDAERSGFSSALTLDRPLRPVKLPNGFWSVNGTPADCVYLAMNGLFQQPFDLVISGINSGANLGDDVLYSGTVGAAFEGRLMHTPALAVSLVGKNVRHYSHASDYAIAAQWVHDFVKNGIPALPSRHIYNINIPDQPVLDRVKVTRMGTRVQPLPIMPATDPRGRQVYWIGLAGEAAVQDTPVTPQILTDFEAVAAGCVSVTPIQMDATSYTVLEDVESALASQYAR
jgi:5'-nucleotidase